jgi:hypothetical protein
MYYSMSGYYLDRTPNFVSIAQGVVIEDVSITQFSDAEIKELNSIFEQGDFNSDREISTSVDGLSEVLVDQKSYGKLVGWTFLQDEEDQASFARIIVLRNDVARYYYPVIDIRRPDVQKAFLNLNLQLQDAGFNAYISGETLPAGVYEIGILFRSLTRDENYYDVIPWRINRTSSEFTLESH